MIGKNIRTIRRSKDLTLKKLAELSGLNLVQIQKYEQGKTEPGIYNLVKISKALECTIDELDLNKGTSIDMAIIGDAKLVLNQLIIEVKRQIASRRRNETLLL